MTNKKEKCADASFRVGAWLSAALDDPRVCKEMKQDILAWMELGHPGIGPDQSEIFRVIAQKHRDSSEFLVGKDQILIAFGKYIAGYRPKDPSWSSLDQEAYDMAMGKEPGPGILSARETHSTIAKWLRRRINNTEAATTMPAPGVYISAPFARVVLEILEAVDYTPVPFGKELKK